jgi:hypothetical protein
VPELSCGTPVPISLRTIPVRFKFVNNLPLVAFYIFGCAQANEKRSFVKCDAAGGVSNRAAFTHADVFLRPPLFVQLQGSLEREEEKKRTGNHFEKIHTYLHPLYSIRVITTRGKGGARRRLRSVLGV